MAVQICGTNVASLKGKTTRVKPTIVVEDVISIPPELLDAQKHDDTFGCRFCLPTGLASATEGLHDIDEDVVKLVDVTPRRT
jgi:hypothetical protein